MGLAEQRTKSAKNAADLKARGISHGKRMSSPYPNSGGRTMNMHQVGSAANQRRLDKQNHKKGTNR